MLSCLSIDVLVRKGDEMYLEVRDQKTSRSVGLYRCPIPKDLSGLFNMWLDVARPIVLEGQEDHGYIFFQWKKKEQFKQQSFSKYMGIAFKAVTGHDVNLQTIRRIFAEGVSHVPQVAKNC
jgi:hypothetical protein